jgi:outer membrane cobalamin receptor
LNVPSGPVTLDITCLGYAAKSVSVPATQSTVTVVLEEDTMMLDETVVVGYGTQKKVNLTGAVTSVDDKALADRVSPNLSSMLQGAVPGLSISTSSGNPGSTGTLQIRGTGSINGGNPLVLIDGVEGEMDRVNPMTLSQFQLSRTRLLLPFTVHVLHSV